MATNWGILSTGKISHDFANSFSVLDPNEHKIVAVAARTYEFAENFAADRGITKIYGSYKELAEDPSVDVVYIATITPTHHDLIILALKHGKHVLCEKPLCMNVRETKAVLEFAQQKKLFLMEAVWSRFFPSYQEFVRELSTTVIGEVKQVLVTMGLPIPEDYRLTLKERGGGTIMCLAVYCIQFASLAFNGEKPIKVISSGHLNAYGVDDSNSTTLVYEGGRSATFIMDLRVLLPNEGFAVGTTGTLKLKNPFWSTTALETPTGVKEFPLPDTGKKFNTPNAVGLSYQCKEVRRCIQNGLTQSSIVSHKDSLLFAEITESMCTQIGLEY